tara:strand:+ start:170 stop:493 length:324 start_codon:yes stop_codon:yes gene_type:complete
MFFDNARRYGDVSRSKRFAIADEDLRFRWRIEFSFGFVFSHWSTQNGYRGRRHSYGVFANMRSCDIYAKAFEKSQFDVSDTHESAFETIHYRWWRIIREIGVHYVIL